ncbi:conserved Plasmodium protein, unknown function [Plasmodium malariae]|uniref:Uncharacterized protein n=1 Tax=Plasmodium malariae TaxID=5858 RepID=A0A1A8X6J7_PLAMA|nr:conserved Plasmodium protein, unknown function [Plasmodium malariae]
MENQYIFPNGFSSKGEYINGNTGGGDNISLLSGRVKKDETQMKEASTKRSKNANPLMKRMIEGKCTTNDSSKGGTTIQPIDACVKNDIGKKEEWKETQEKERRVEWKDVQEKSGRGEAKWDSNGSYSDMRTLKDEDNYEFLHYINYFFIENKSDVDIYFSVKDFLKNSSPTLVYLLKNISLLSHIIYFYEIKEQHLLTSNDIEVIKNILYKNEDNHSNNYNVVYNCIIVLLQIVRLSTHAGVKNFAYYHLLRNLEKFSFLFFLNFNLVKVKHRENFYVLRNNEATFISDFITLHIVHMLNNDNKLIRIFALKLCLIFAKKVSQSPYIINYILNILFQQINIDEYVYSFSVLIQLIPLLSHDVIYHVIVNVYKNVVKNQGAERISSSLKELEEVEHHSSLKSSKCGETPKGNEHHLQHIPREQPTHTSNYLRMQEEESSCEPINSSTLHHDAVHAVHENNEKKIMNSSKKDEGWSSGCGEEEKDQGSNFKRENEPRNNQNKNMDEMGEQHAYCESAYVNKKNKHRRGKGETEREMEREMSGTMSGKKSRRSAMRILRNPFAYAACIFLSEIANKLNEFIPYVSLYLFKKLWRILNNAFEIDIEYRSEKMIMNIIDHCFYSTTLLSFKNSFLLNLQIIIIKFLLNSSQTELLRQRAITYFALRSLLYLINKGKIYLIFHNASSGVDSYPCSENFSSFYFNYFSFICTVRDYELQNWFNCLHLGSNLSIYAFVHVLYKFFKATNSINFEDFNDHRDCPNYVDKKRNNFPHVEQCKNRDTKENDWMKQESVSKDDNISLHNTYFDLYINKFLRAYQRGGTSIEDPHKVQGGVVSLEKKKKKKK